MKNKITNAENSESPDNAVNVKKLEIQNKFHQIGDVRGMGLFLGIDLVKNNITQDEDKDLCTYIKNRMRASRILIGSEGPKDNVLKIRPPLTIDEEGVDMILHYFEKIMNEV